MAVEGAPWLVPPIGTPGLTETPQLAALRESLGGVTMTQIPGGGLSLADLYPGAYIPPTGVTGVPTPATGAVPTGLLGGLTGLLGLIPGIGGILAAIASAGVAGYGGYQALGGGAGGGLFGLNILGGDNFVLGGVPFGGPGLAEPTKGLLKEWHIRMDSKQGDFTLQFYLVQTARGKRVFLYNTRTKAWKHWALPKLAVIGKNVPTHRMVTRLRRNLKKSNKDAQTILQLTSPTKYAKQIGYRKYKKRR